MSIMSLKSFGLEYVLKSISKILKLLIIGLFANFKYKIAFMSLIVQKLRMTNICP